MLSKKGLKDVLWQIHCEFPENPHIGGCLLNSVFGIMGPILLAYRALLPILHMIQTSSADVII